MDKWISFHRYCPPVREDYEVVSSSYQSKLVEIITDAGEVLRAEMIVYGNPLSGFRVDWWRDGCLSEDKIDGKVIAWRPLDQHYFVDDDYMTLEEVYVDIAYWEGLHAERGE